MPLTREQRIEYQRKKYRDFRLWLEGYKTDKKCAICGYNEHTEILQFHHVNPKDKSFEISDGNACSRSKEAILNEMKKCIIVCPNCHRWIHYDMNAGFRRE